MNKPVPPIFIFADDIGVFLSVAEAERHYEPWIVDMVKVAYDVQGTVLHVDVGAGVTITPIDPPTKEYEAFVARLRAYLVGVAEERLDLLDGQWARDALGDELIRWVVDHRT